MSLNSRVLFQCPKPYKPQEAEYAFTIIGIFNFSLAPNNILYLKLLPLILSSVFLIHILYPASTLQRKLRVAPLFLIQCLLPFKNQSHLGLKENESRCSYRPWWHTSRNVESCCILLFFILFKAPPNTSPYKPFLIIGPLEPQRQS